MKEEASYGDVAGWLEEVEKATREAERASQEVVSLTVACRTAGAGPVSREYAERAINLARYIDNIGHLMRDPVALGIRGAAGMSFEAASELAQRCLGERASEPVWRQRDDGLTAAEGLIRDSLDDRLRRVERLAREARSNGESAWQAAGIDRPPPSFD